VFSPDGRLFQVEYAREAVRTGSTSIGVVCKDGVVLAAHKRLLSPLIVGDSQEKIFQIDSHIAAVSSGFAGDARKLIDFARLEAQKHRLTYNEPMTTDLLTKKVGDYVQFFTQYAGVRPFGVSLLIAGVDKGDDKSRLFETDPSGALFEYKATAIGAGRKAVEELFEKEYRDEIRVSDGIKLAIKALRKVVDEKVTAENVIITVIDKSSAQLKTYSREDISKALAETKPEKPEKPEKEK
jgi:proteasome alpha subunit